MAQAQGATIPQAVKQIGVTEQTFYRWRKEYGGMRLDQAKRLKQLHREARHLFKTSSGAGTRDETGSGTRIEPAAKMALAEETDFVAKHS